MWCLEGNAVTLSQILAFHGSYSWIPAARTSCFQGTALMEALCKKPSLRLHPIPERTKDCKDERLGETAAGLVVPYKEIHVQKLSDSLALSFCSSDNEISTNACLPLFSISKGHLSGYGLNSLLSANVTSPHPSCSPLPLPPPTSLVAFQPELHLSDGSNLQYMFLSTSWKVLGTSGGFRGCGWKRKNSPRVLSCHL